MIGALSQFISKLGERGITLKTRVSTQAIFEVCANPGSTTAQRYPTTICGGNGCSSQYYHLHRTVRRLNGSQAATSVFYERDLKRRSNMVPTGAEAALHSSYDDQEIEVLLLGAHSPGRVRSIVKTSSPEHRSNRVDRSMGSRDQAI
jgi:hypothetical protein